MKKTNYGFFDAIFSGAYEAAKRKGNKQMYFDWDKAAEIIKAKLKDYPDLIAEAGLQGDWDYTGGEIFSKGKPRNDDYTYLSSNWAAPTLILTYGNHEQEEIECFTTDESLRFDEKSKWDEQSLSILGINL